MRNSQLFRMVMSAAAAVAVSNGLAASQQTPSKEGKMDEAAYDRIVDDFIQYDIGHVRDPFAIDQIRTRFNALTTDDAVPALVRGLNRSTRLRYSCPITAISSRLRSLVGHTKNPDVATYVLKNLERRDVGSYNYHMAGVFNAAENAVVRTRAKIAGKEGFDRKVASDQQRLAFMPGMKLTDLPPRGATRGATDENGESKNARPSAESRSNSADGTAKSKTEPAAEQFDFRKSSVAELVAKLSEFESQPKTLEELHRRASAGNGKEIAAHAAAIVKSLEEGDASVRETAARLLGLLRVETAVAKLIDALEDSNPHVRSAASTALTRITRQLFGPNDNATTDQVKQAVTRWREWWDRQSKTAERGGAAR